MKFEECREELKQSLIKINDMINSKDEAVREMSIKAVTEYVLKIFPDGLSKNTKSVNFEGIIYTI